MKAPLAVVAMFSSVMLCAHASADMTPSQQETIVKYCPQAASHGSFTGVVWLVVDEKTHGLKFHQRFSCKRDAEVFIGGVMVPCGSVFWNYLGEMGGGQSVLCLIK
jgi:hypothetical protein